MTEMRKGKMVSPSLILPSVQPYPILSYHIISNLIPFCFIACTYMQQQVYTDLAEEICTKHQERLDDFHAKQYWIAVAGGPGSGKSTLTEALCTKINRRAGKEVSCVIPMDGYHYSRSELQAMGEDESNDYTYDELLKRRGSPWTFNAPQLIEDLTRAKSTGTGSLPVYSRKLSDPVPDGVELKDGHKIVFVEGNYLLNYNDDAWSPLAPVFDEKWYVVCESLDVQRERLVERHLETWSDEKTRQFGAGRDGAALKADDNDMKNVRTIEENSREHADRVILSFNCDDYGCDIMDEELFQSLLRSHP